ncbi:nucleotidyltransferase domain-containing protein [Sutcliffiella horikoshii]|uniref:DNA polymerase beta superfamily protein n=1 Tax=Sutcliffiella horikoshii TaxID=79883 RepID=UPI00203CE455|nr:nucleotidyltransferase domain-containing protein [Sutcliffiella horikoshii]
MNRIEDLLHDIETSQHVKILYACEAGSRAYGFATNSSDFDIRFIYISPLKDYLSLMRKEDTITQQDTMYDIQGWDLKKALLLAGKSNPSLYEWMLSPIVYRELSPVLLSLKGTMLKDHSKKVLAFHYANMAKKNLHEWSEKKDGANLIHAIRASMMLEQVIHNDMELGTIQFQKLIKRSNIFNSEDLSLLFSLKKGEEVSEHPLFSHLFAKTSNFITVSKESLELLGNKKVDLHELEMLFFRQLGIEGESDFKS